MRAFRSSWKKHLVVTPVRNSRVIEIVFSVGAGAFSRIAIHCTKIYWHQQRCAIWRSNEILQFWQKTGRCWNISNSHRHIKRYRQEYGLLMWMRSKTYFWSEKLNWFITTRSASWEDSAKSLLMEYGIWCWLSASISCNPITQQLFWRLLRCLDCCRRRWWFTVRSIRRLRNWGVNWQSCRINRMHMSGTC